MKDRVPMDKDEILAELKAAFDQEAGTSKVPLHHAKSLDEILESFIFNFYINLKVTSQHITEAQLKQNVELQAAKDQVQKKDNESKQLAVSLAKALMTKQVYMEEL